MDSDTKKIFIVLICVIVVSLIIAFVGVVLWTFSSNSDIQLFVGNDSEYKDLIKDVNESLS